MLNEYLWDINPNIELDKMIKKYFSKAELEISPLKSLNLNIELIKNLEISFWNRYKYRKDYDEICTELNEQLFVSDLTKYIKSGGNQYLTILEWNYLFFVYIENLRVDNFSYRIGCSKYITVDEILSSEFYAKLQNSN